MKRGENHQRWSGSLSQLVVGTEGVRVASAIIITNYCFYCSIVVIIISAYGYYWFCFYVCFWHVCQYIGSRDTEEGWAPGQKPQKETSSLLIVDLNVISSFENLRRSQKSRGL